MELGMLFEKTIHVFLGETKDTFNIAGCYNNFKIRKQYYLKVIKKIKKIILNKDFSCVKKNHLLKICETLSDALTKKNVNFVEIECYLFRLCGAFLDFYASRDYANNINDQKIKLAGEMDKQGFDSLKIGAVLNVMDEEAIYLVKQYKNKLI
jgi:hypothetical protein